MLDALGKYAKFAPVVLRAFLGIGFVAAGMMKILDIPGITPMFATFFGDLAKPLLILVAVVEVLGGLALLLGVWARVAALILSVVMVVAMIVSWNIQPFGFFGDIAQVFGMVPFAYLVMCIAIALRGAQKWALLPDKT